MHLLLLSSVLPVAVEYATMPRSPLLLLPRPLDAIRHSVAPRLNSMPKTDCISTEWKERAGGVGILLPHIA